MTLEQELSNVRSYLQIQQLMHDGDFDVEIDVAAEILQYESLNLILQPLVENAVRHGVTKKKGGGTVAISVRETANSFLVKVEDTGCGFDPEHYMDDGRVHIGIRNEIRYRIPPRTRCGIRHRLSGSIDGIG